MSRLRVLLGLAGVAMIGYGGYQILHYSAATRPAKLAEWLLGALVLHDGVLSWGVLGAGWLSARLARGRTRAYVEGGLVCAALILVIGLPLVYRRGKSPSGSTLLTQNYAAHLAVLLGTVAAVAAGARAIRLLGDRRQARPGHSTTNERPSTDQASPNE
jgi:hypothetical protein